MKKFLFNEGWKFKKEAKIFQKTAEDYFDSYRSNTKTGLMTGPKSMSFYDGEWETVNLPHDWVIAENPSDKNHSSQGYRPQGAVWYRKHFSINEKYKNKRIYIKFDGIATSAEIYLNNIKIGGSEDGYNPIFIDISDFVFFDKINTVAVRADCSVKEGWWYEGGGIYRNTYIIIKDSSHFAEDGVFAYTKRTDENTWSIHIEAEAENLDNCELSYEFLGKTYEKNIIEVKNPKLWNADHPNLYELKAILKKDGEICDEQIVKFGFREITFDSENGFFVNGKSEKIKGVCLHHDHGGVGVVVDKSLLRYRLKKLKEMGCNGIRTSHNPQCPEFYEVCDELGFYIMNEIRHFSSTALCLNELELFIKRDRNHPSVVLWSLFSEEPLQCTEPGERMMRKMLEIVRKYDKTRPVTGGMNGPLELDGVVKYVDVMGFNYLQYGYDEFHKLFPHIPIIGSETGSYMGTRDILATDREKSHIFCYGRKLGENLYHWSDTPGGTWKYITDSPFVCGGFYWTGLDYYGEPSPFGWPGITSNFGAMDVCGFPKDCYFWHKALWNDEYMLEIPKPWNGKNGETAEFTCYSNCETLELYLNGEKISEEPNDPYNPKLYKIKYSDGILKAVGKVGGKSVIEKEVRTYGKERLLKITPSATKAFDTDFVIFDVYLTDEYGQIIKTEDKNVEITLKNGALIGAANGDNASHSNVKNNIQPMFGGCVQFIVRAEKAGTLQASFCCENSHICGEASIEIQKNVVESIPAERFVAYANRFMISDVHSGYPKKEEIINSHFTWIPTTIGAEKNLIMSGKTGYATLSCLLDIPDKAFESKKLVIENISGCYDIYLGGSLLYKSEKYQTGSLSLNLNDFSGEINPLCFVFTLKGEDCGISGNVYAELN